MTDGLCRRASHAKRPPLSGKADTAARGRRGSYWPKADTRNAARRLCEGY